MGLSKSTRIGILLGIDSAFFLLELIVGMLTKDGFPVVVDQALTICFRICCSLTRTGGGFIPHGAMSSYHVQDRY